MKSLCSLFVCTLLLLLLASNQLRAEEENEAGTAFPEAPLVWDTPVPGAAFKHTTHVSGQGLSCAECHPDLFIMQAGTAAEADDFTMAAMNKGQYCGSCHNGGSAFSTTGSCTRCHIGVRGAKRLLQEE